MQHQDCNITTTTSTWKPQFQNCNKKKIVALINSNFQTMERTKNIYIYINEPILNVQHALESLICS